MVRKDKILRDVLLKMSYDLSKTLNENIAMVEQKPDNLMPFQPDAPQYKKSNGTLDTDKYQKDMKQMTDLVYEYRHGLMDIAAIGTLFIPVVGPFLSLGLELANSGMYFAEGENYSGGLALAFALIPFGELVKIPAVRKLGNEGLQKLLKKTAVKNSKYTDDEIKALEQINKNKSWISKRASYQAVKSVIKTAFSGAPLYKIVRVMYNFGKKYPKLFNITKMGLTIGGIWYSYDRLAEIYGIKNKSEIQTKTDNTTSKVKIEEPIVVTDFDNAWDYKKDGDKYYTKRKGSDKWILVTGNTELAIKEKVFKQVYKPSASDLELRKKLESEYKTNPNEIIKQIAPQLSSTTDEEKNKQVIDAFSDILKDYR